MIKPKKLIVLVLSIFMGGFIGVLIALLRNMLNSGLRNIAPIANQYHLKNLGKVIYSNQLDSTSKSFTPLLAASQPTEIVVEQMRQISTTLYHHAQNASKPIVQVIGTHKNTGNSTLIANIAVAAPILRFFSDKEKPMPNINNNISSKKNGAPLPFRSQAIISPSSLPGE